MRPRLLVAALVTGKDAGGVQPDPAQNTMVDRAAQRYRNTIIGCPFANDGSGTGSDWQSLELPTLRVSCRDSSRVAAGEFEDSKTNANWPMSDLNVLNVEVTQAQIADETTELHRRGVDLHMELCLSCDV